MKQVFGRRERALWTGTWAGSESQALLIAESLTRGISSRFPLAAHLALPGSQSDLVYFPCARARCLARMDSSEEASG